MKLYALVVWLLVGVVGGWASGGAAYGAVIKEVLVEANKQGKAKVEPDAIRNLMSSTVGSEFSMAKVRKDIRALYELGYFSDIRFYREDLAGEGVRLIVKVQEKPAIARIEFTGFDEISEDDLRKSLETKLYTIVSEAAITTDMRMIEKKYAEKGYYLALVTYTTEPIGENEVALTFHIEESGKVLVGDVHVLGRRYFSEEDLLDKLATRPFTRWSATLGAPSMYQDDFVKRDLEFLAYYYKDHGFANVKVGKPVQHLDPDRHFARVTFNLEEGQQYRVGSIKVSGDIGKDLYEPPQLLEPMELKPSELFRYSRFARDIELLVDKYGDLGYAYVDVNPLTQFDHDKRLVHIDYRITKGEKVYFGQMTIIGNTKTRDNVIRREFEVHDSELYSGTKLSESKRNVTRLGFFDEVQVLKERDADVTNLLNLKFKVKEKPTGQLQAAVGYSPATDKSESLFVQGRYDEKNQSGHGWNTNLTLRWGGSKSYKFDAGFHDPRLNDSQWSLGLNLGYERQTIQYASGVKVPEIDTSVSATVGRSLFELVRGSVTLRHSQLQQLEQRADAYFLDDVRRRGIKNSMIFGLSRRDLDNYLDPSEGTDVHVRHSFTGGLLGGHYQYMESSSDADYFIPLDFSDTYRTYFKLHGFIGKLWPVADKALPSDERYRLGGPYDLRGYKYHTLGPKDRRSLGPLGGNLDYNLGGDKKFFVQLEYFVPLIPQAGIKGILFVDAGKVWREEEDYSLTKLHKDVGFGLRWITPVAPFRFEWAYPYDDKTNTFGDMEFVFNIGF